MFSTGMLYLRQARMTAPTASGGRTCSRRHLLSFSTFRFFVVGVLRWFFSHTCYTRLLLRPSPSSSPVAPRPSPLLSAARCPTSAPLPLRSLFTTFRCLHQRFYPWLAPLGPVPPPPASSPARRNKPLADYTFLPWPTVHAYLRSPPGHGETYAISPFLPRRRARTILSSSSWRDSIPQHHYLYAGVDRASVLTCSGHRELFN